jgi:hypothetical protein
MRATRVEASISMRPLCPDSERSGQKSALDGGKSRKATKKPPTTSGVINM